MSSLQPPPSVGCVQNAVEDAESKAHKKSPGRGSSLRGVPVRAAGTECRGVRIGSEPVQQRRGGVASWW